MEEIRYLLSKISGDQVLEPGWVIRVLQQSCNWSWQKWLLMEQTSVPTKQVPLPCVIKPKPGCSRFINIPFGCSRQWSNFSRCYYPIAQTSKTLAPKLANEASHNPQAPFSHSSTSSHLLGCRSRDRFKKKLCNWISTMSPPFASLESLDDPLTPEVHHQFFLPTPKSLKLAVDAAEWIPNTDRKN